MESPRRSTTFSPRPSPEAPVSDAALPPADAPGGDGAEPARRRRGRPRLPGIDARILAAARALEAELGYQATSIDAIAERAGVARTAIYRRWPNKGILLYEAVIAPDPAAARIPDTGDVRADLLEVLRANSQGLRSPSIRGLLAALSADALTDERLAALLRTRYFGPRADAIVARAERAIARGELAPTLDVDLVPALLTGSLQYLWVVRGSRLDDGDLARVVDAIIGAHRPPGSAEARKPDR